MTRAARAAAAAAKLLSRWSRNLSFFNWLSPFLLPSLPLSPSPSPIGHLCGCGLWFPLPKFYNILSQIVIVLLLRFPPSLSLVFVLGGVVVCVVSFVFSILVCLFLALSFLDLCVCVVSNFVFVFFFSGRVLLKIMTVQREGKRERQGATLREKKGSKEKENTKNCTAGLCIRRNTHPQKKKKKKRKNHPLSLPPSFLLSPQNQQQYPPPALAPASACKLTRGRPGAVLVNKAGLSNIFCTTS
jgi:hypothetical protein